VALAWFIAPMKVGTDTVGDFRYCAVADFNAQIFADGGVWSEAEILGGAAIVKVRASAATLTTINAAAGFLRFPNHVDLTDTLGDLTVNQRQALLNEALALGYTQAQIDAALPADWAAITLRQVLNFLNSRWKRPLAIVTGSTIFESADWADGTPRLVDDVAAAVT
jgi:hypothetical protein